MNSLWFHLDYSTIVSYLLESPFLCLPVKIDFPFCPSVKNKTKKKTKNKRKEQTQNLNLCKLRMSVKSLYRVTVREKWEVLVRL